MARWPNANWPNANFCSPTRHRSELTKVQKDSQGRRVSTSSRCFRRRFSWAALTSSALRRRQAAARWRASRISGSGPDDTETSSAKVAGSSFARAAAASAAFFKFVAKVSSALPSQASQTRRIASFRARVHAP